MKTPNEIMSTIARILHDLDRHNLKADLIVLGTNEHFTIRNMEGLIPFKIDCSKKIPMEIFGIPTLGIGVENYIGIVPKEFAN